MKKRNNTPIFFTVLAGLLAGLFLPRLVTYFTRLFRQPLFSMRNLPQDSPLSTMDLADRAYEIALDNLNEGLEVRRLENGVEKLILCAGVRNFREPWARDTGFAHLGLMELDKPRAAKETLEVFLETQNESGQFPVKIHSTSILNRYLHSLFGRQQPIDAPIKPKFITAHNTISLDGNGLLVIAMLNYVEKSGDEAFLRTHWHALRAAVRWMKTQQEEDGLLHQGAFTDWADTIGRQGKILYTNVIYWKALDELARAAETYDLPMGEITLQDRADFMRDAINTHFWREDLGYFVTSQLFDNLSSSGNLLAISWGLTTPEQAHKILDAMRFFGMAVPVPTKVVHRAYPKQFIAIENRIGGIADYHTYFAWLWLGAWHVIALTRMERLEEARELLYNMSRVIVRDGAVHEVYAPNGSYAANLWYTSESPLTWSAGMFLHAYHVYQRHVSSNKN